MLINLKTLLKYPTIWTWEWETLSETQTKATTVHVSEEKIFLAFNEQGHN